MCLYSSPNMSQGLAWTAPELLRTIGTTSNPICRSWSKAADVYSFGIIMQEILLKGAPFCNNKPLTLAGSLTACFTVNIKYQWTLCAYIHIIIYEVYSSHVIYMSCYVVAECVFRVLDSHPQYPFRPCIQNNGEAPKGYCQLMEAAWSEREDDRPLFSDILLKLQQNFPQLKYAFLQLDHFQYMHTTASQWNIYLQ